MSRLWIIIKRKLSSSGVMPGCLQFPHDASQSVVGEAVSALHGMNVLDSSPGRFSIVMYFSFSSLVHSFSLSLSTAYPFCNTEPDSQEHSLQCTIVNHKIEVRGTYSDIFDEDIPSEISETVMKITKLRKEIFL